MAELPQTLTSDPSEMFALGRRHLAVKDYSAAASCLSKACELLGEKYGQQADECGEACFWYGRSLLGLAREESGVLGDGLPGNDENQEEEEDEDDNDAEDNNETDNVNEDKTENSSKDKIVEGESEQKMEVASSDEVPDNAQAASSSTDLEQPGPSSGVASSSTAEGEPIDNEDEEVENLQLAWEVFELARDIFLKRGERGKKELADVYLHLGEVSLESEVYDKAISDMGKSLELFKELYSADDRRIAETHYQIGLAHSLSNGFDDAITHFKSAVEILENRIKNLQSTASDDETVKKNLSVDPFYTIEGEIKELTELLPEIREKIQDTIDYKAEAIKSVRETLNLNKTNGESSKTNGCSSSSLPHEEKKASDISHLIKRKRKPDDDVVEECSAPKKPAN